MREKTFFSSNTLQNKKKQLHFFIRRIFTLKTNEIYDVTIIGAGPVGLFAAVYAGMRKVTTKVIESLPQVGGQLATLYPEKFIYDIPGVPRVRAREFIQQLEKQLEMFQPNFCLGEKVEHLEKNSDGIFTLTTDKGTHYTRSVIVAVGKGSFTPRKLGLAAESKFEMVNIHYHVKDINQFSGQTVAIAGGGDSALDWALMLKGVAKEIFIVHRRDKFRAHEHTVELVKKSTIQTLTPYVVDRLIDEQDFKGVFLQQVKTKETLALPVDHLLVSYGFTSNIEPIDAWDFEFERGKIVVGRDMSTTIDGVYAIGDIASYTEKVELIATGFGEAPIAVLHAMHYAYPEMKVSQAHSTSLFDK